MAAAKEPYLEVHVFELIAEQTGVSEAWSDVRMRRGVCRSMTELRAKSRRMGDGYYYLAASAWPVGVSLLSLAKARSAPAART